MVVCSYTLIPHANANLFYSKGCSKERQESRRPQEGQEDRRQEGQEGRQEGHQEGRQEGCPQEELSVPFE